MAIASSSREATWPSVSLTDSRRSAWLPLFVICGIAAALRFATLGIQSFDYDESFTVGIVSGSLGHALHQIPITESTPPLYYILAWRWAQLFGVSEAGLRSLSALLGTALMPVVFLIGRRLASQRAGLVAALLAAVSPFLVWYSQEARTYALLALLSALSFWVFVRALDDPQPRRLWLWALASSAAVLSHYFAGYLVACEALWLMIATRRRSAVAASAAVAAVGAALTPLVISQADHQSLIQWIGGLSLGSRIKEVVKKWITGEITPTNSWQLALVIVLVVGALAYAARRLTDHERRGAILTFGTAAAAVLIPLALDLAGFHYLISKNVMPAMIVFLVGVALILGAERAGAVGVLGAGVAAAFFLALTIDGAVDPALQRPDYRSAARALGAPERDQVVVTPNLGNKPMALYRFGARAMPPDGWLARQIVLVLPLPRADVSSVRPRTPRAPSGFAFEARKDARTYTLICYGAPAARLVVGGPLIALADTGGATAQVWPQASKIAGASAITSSVCGKST
jgi:hypothetical protein